MLNGRAEEIHCTNRLLPSPGYSPPPLSSVSVWRWLQAPRGCFWGSCKQSRTRLWKTQRFPLFIPDTFQKNIHDSSGPIRKALSLPLPATSHATMLGRCGTQIIYIFPVRTFFCSTQGIPSVSPSLLNISWLPFHVYVTYWRTVVGLCFMLSDFICDLSVCLCLSVLVKKMFDFECLRPCST